MTYADLLSALSRPFLYELVQSLEKPGYSKASKGELVACLIEEVPVDILLPSLDNDALRDLLRRLEQKTSGNKGHMVERLLACIDDDEMEPDEAENDDDEVQEDCDAEGEDEAGGADEGDERETPRAPPHVGDSATQVEPCEVVADTNPPISPPQPAPSPRQPSTSARATSPHPSGGAMVRPFGNDYYAEESARPTWHEEDRRLAGRLDPLLKALDIDAKQRITQAVSSWRTGLHHRLRGTTQLGRSDAGGMRVTIEVTDRLPPPVLNILLGMPDALLWVLLHRGEIAATQKGLDAILQALPTLHGPSGFQGIGLGRNAVMPAAEGVRRLDHAAGERADRVVRDILNLRGDILGAYYFRRGRIELHWVVIWMVATHIRVAPDDLAVAVLAHEMAHLYTHVGQDADGHEWDTDAFHRADDRIVEGLAQFYTQFVLHQVATSGEGNPRPLEAFERFLPEQAEPYTCFRDWMPDHRKRAEVLRRALLEVRTRRIGDYAHFRALLKQAALDM